MNYLIEQALRTKITGLSFVERYGGVVRSMQYKDVGKVPVSTLLTSDQCKDPSFYKLLVPASAYKSVCYLEALSNTGPTFSGPKQNAITFKNSLRFVAWLNLRKLGIDGDYNPERFAIEAMSAIKGRTDFNKDQIQGAVEILNFRMGTADFNTAFGKYSYSGKDSLFFDPYGFFFFDFDVKLSINAGCLDAITLGDPMDCIGVWEQP